MSLAYEISECPNCGRAFIAGIAARGGRGLGRCRICGTPLVPGAREKEAEVERRLYGTRVELVSRARPRSEP